MFWYFRLEFLSEARFLSELESFFPSKPSFFTGYIDGLNDIKFVDSTHWTREPYDLVKKKKQYDKPYDYFSKEIAEKILQARSLQADLYWANADIRNKKQKDPTGRNYLAFTKIKILWKWSISCVTYALLIILGLGFAGWTWPKRFRRYLLAVGLKGEETTFTSARTSFEAEQNRKVSFNVRTIEDDERNENIKVQKMKDVKDEINDDEDSDTVSDLASRASQC